MLHPLKLVLSGALIVSALNLSSTTARADAWWIVSLFHKTTLEECMSFAQASFRRLGSKDIKRGTQVVYGFNLHGNGAHDSIIRCQGEREVPAIGTSDFAVIFIVYNKNSGKDNAKTAKRLANKLTDHYEALMRRGR